MFPTLANPSRACALAGSESSWAFATACPDSQRGHCHNRHAVRSPGGGRCGNTPVFRPHRHRRTDLYLRRGHRGSKPIR